MIILVLLRLEQKLSLLFLFRLLEMTTGTPCRYFLSLDEGRKTDEDDGNAVVFLLSKELSINIMTVSKK